MKQAETGSDPRAARRKLPADYEGYPAKVAEDLPRDGSARSAAMVQLRERGYADKYRGAGEPVHLIAVEFSKQTRNLAAFEAAPA